MRPDINPYVDLTQAELEKLFELERKLIVAQYRIEELELELRLEKMLVKNILEPARLAIGLVN